MPRAQEQLREYRKGAIGHFRISAWIRFVDASPMNVTGKLQKFRMRKMAMERLRT
jgi:fatty-acyl-CoA synthase